MRLPPWWWCMTGGGTPSCCSIGPAAGRATRPRAGIWRAPSLTDCARREVLEETGLTLGPLTFKSILHWAHAETGERYMVFNYYTEQFSGEAARRHRRGAVCWMPMDQLDRIQMSEGMRERLEPMFFGGAPVEMHIRYDDQDRRQVTVHALG